MHPSSEQQPLRTVKRFALFPHRLRQRVTSPRRRYHARALFWPALLPIIIMSGILLNWTFLAQQAYAAPLAPTTQPGHQTAQQYLKTGQPDPRNRGKFTRPTSEPVANTLDTNAAREKPLPSAEPASMHDLTYTLDSSFTLHRPTLKASSATPTVVGTSIPTGTTPFQMKGSDGRLEVDLPRGSLDFSQATLADGSAPVGQLILQIHQISGHYIEAESILGTYQIQIVDSQGHVVQGVRVVQPVTIRYHYQSWEMKDLDLDPTQVHLAWPAQLVAARAAKQATTGLVIPMTNTASTQTLTAQSTVLSGVLTAGARV